MKILIANGHGLETPGKRSPDGRFREYAWTREIARRLVQELVQIGYDANLLVPEDADIPLRVRAMRTNTECVRYGQRNVLLISIHVNAAGLGDRWYDASIKNTRLCLLLYSKKICCFQYLFVFL